MNDGIIKKRIKAVRRRLNKKKINCLILTKPANVTYTTGFSGSDSWVAITPAGVYLLTDSRYTEQAQNQCPSCRVIQRAGPMVEAISKLIKKLSSVQTVAIEKSTTIAAFEALKKQVKARLKSVANIIEEVRSSKDAGEIAAIRAAAQIAAQALKQTLRYIKTGITENELAGMLDFQIRKLGAVNSFDTIVAFGPNASHPHHQPGARKLKTNDSILIDFGVRYKNYCCDLTRCFAVGRPTHFYRKVYNAVQEAQAAALKMVKPGVEIRQIDAAAREVISKYGLPVYGHGTGHGLGLEVHEDPVIAANSEGRLETGMVFTIEPGVYIPGKLGVRIEDDILVSETGYKILSSNCQHLPLPPI
ncbi:MAG TPA: aminopeptidase P family protein [Phycisphaerales bacterium]|nr:aminopeptidase P family protein [Phycisphaerales bacterium]